MITLDIRARDRHRLPHRIMEKGEVWARVQFKTEADMHAFRKAIGWTAFEMVEVKQEQPKK